jgi:hypothetical protein
MAPEEEGIRLQQVGWTLQVGQLREHLCKGCGSAADDRAFPVSPMAKMFRSGFCEALRLAATNLIHLN